MAGIIERTFNRLTLGLEADKKKTELNRFLGVWDGAEEDSKRFLLPKAWLDTTIVDACLKLFTKQFPGTFVPVPTWTKQPAGFAKLPAVVLYDINSALSDRGGKKLKAVIRPFLVDNHFFLVVIRSDCKATIYDSLNTGSSYVDLVGAQLKLMGWHEWQVVVGQCAFQNNTSDCGVHTIANAAYIIAGRPLPTSIDATFWRVTCWSALGLADDDEHLANSAFFNHHRGAHHNIVSSFFDTMQDQGGDGLAVLKTISHGASVKWWSFWEKRIGLLNRMFGEFDQACKDELDEGFCQNLEDDLVSLMAELEEYEQKTEERTRQQLCLQMAVGERLAAVVLRMGTLKNIIPVLAARTT